MSPRPKRFRRMELPPRLLGFQPMGTPFEHEDKVIILYEEYEALKLADYENISHAQAARNMNISRPTFTRIYDLVRKKIAMAFVEGKAIVIEGGDVTFDKQWYRCLNCHQTFYASGKKSVYCPYCKSDKIQHINEMIQRWRTGKHYQYRGNQAPIFCMCVECAKTVSKVPGLPCSQAVCPSCGGRMIRK